MTLPFPSLNHVHLIGKLDRQPHVQVDGKRRITTLAVITMDDDGDRTHRVVVFEQMLVQPIFDSLEEGSVVQIIGQLDFDEKGYFVSVPPRRGCDLQLLAASTGAPVHDGRPQERSEPPKPVPVTPAPSKPVTQASSPAATPSPSQAAMQQPEATAARPATTTPPPGRPAPGQRPGGLAALSSAASTAAHDDDQDDGRDSSESSDEPDHADTQAAAATAQVSQPNPVAAATATARPGAPPPRPTPGGPRPAPAAAPQPNSIQRPAPPARPGATRPGGGAPVAPRPTMPPSWADEIPFAPEFR